MDLETGRIHHFQDEMKAAMEQLQNPNLVALSTEEAVTLKDLPAAERVEKLVQMRKRALDELRGPKRPA